MSSYCESLFSWTKPKIVFNARWVQIQDSQVVQLLPLHVYSLQQYYFVGKKIHMHSMQNLISCKTEVLK